MKTYKFLTLPLIVALAATLCVQGAVNAASCDDCILSSRMNDQNCALEGTPLTRCSVYDDFVRLDRTLNAEYRRLHGSLSKEDASTLQKAQRRWIKWRDDQCEKEEMDAGCNNGMCAGVAHGNCILSLTERRALELKDFSTNTADARKKAYLFSKNRSD